MFGMYKVHMAEVEFFDQNRYVDTFPISMDTYKYIKDDPFMLISEHIMLTDDPSKNKLTFTVTEEKTFFRIFIESDEIELSLFKKT